MGAAALVVVGLKPPRLSPVLNKLIDRLFHPRFRESEAYVVLDTLAHIAVEQADSLVESLYKALVYNSRYLRVGGVGGKARGKARGCTEDRRGGCG